MKHFDENILMQKSIADLLALMHYFGDGQMVYRQSLLPETDLTKKMDEAAKYHDERHDEIKSVLDQKIKMLESA